MKKKVFLFVSADVDLFLKVQQAFYTSQSPVQGVHLETAAQVVAYLENLHIGASLPLLILLDYGPSAIHVKQEFLHIQQRNPYKSIPVAVYSTSMDKRTQAFFKNWNVKVWGMCDPVEVGELFTNAAEDYGKGMV